jgi:protein-disulfide isomerase
MEKALDIQKEVPGDHARGRPRAPANLIIYGDYECPYTRVAYRSVQRLERRFEERLRFVFRHFPLVDIHPHAQQAAEAAEAAAAQGRFWELHDVLFRRQRALEAPDLRRYASQVGLDTERFWNEVGARTHAGRVSRDVASGMASGVRGTPTIFLNGERYSGDYRPEALGTQLERVIAE